MMNGDGTSVPVANAWKRCLRFFYGGLVRIHKKREFKLRRSHQETHTHKKKAEASPSDFILSLSDLQQVLPVRFGFTSRMHETHQMNASDPVNALLNYGYAILESQCRKALNSVGLEPTVGFLHEAKQTKYPLVYDLQEPYRWLVDSTVISCLENGQFGKSDFYRMDNYVLRLRPEAARKFIDALRIKFNSPVRYKGRLYGSDTVIRLKAQELANYILSRRNELDFSEPRAHLQRTDSAAVRNTILSLTASEARNLGIRKNTLWYLQRRVCTDRSMSIYAKVKAKLPEI